jgi:hypothetical protein
MQPPTVVPAKAKADIARARLQSYSLAYYFLAFGPPKQRGQFGANNQAPSPLCPTGSYAPGFIQIAVGPLNR